MSLISYLKCSSYSISWQTQGGCFLRETTHTLTSHPGQDRPPSRSPSASQPAPTEPPLPTRKRSGADTVRRLLPGQRAVFPEPASLSSALSACEKWCCHKPLHSGQRASSSPCTPLFPLWLAVAAAVRMWSPQRSALHPSESIGEEDEMFFPLSPVPIPPSEHHPVIHLPHRR